ncbi:hypothetical protein Golob_021875 [Gossypium lobatum]|uniref:Uncharacterized protein n=1 Tax=Gossypium lobatum TaxID=34289 RepID=A0A7J8LEV2_9ROSI|nr:hypothetical protein [Gossypium lobatum]
MPTSPICANSVMMMGKGIMETRRMVLLLEIDSGKVIVETRYMGLRLQMDNVYPMGLMFNIPLVG